MAEARGYTFNGEEIRPSLIAADWQGATSRTYYKVDNYADGLLKKGQKIVQLTFGGARSVGEYFIPYEQYMEMVAKYGHDSAAFGETWQLAPFIKETAEGQSIAEGKTKAVVYELTEDVIVAHGETRANTHFGKGNGTQIYIPLADDLSKNGGLKVVESFNLTNATKDLKVAQDVLQDAKDSHSSLYGEEAKRQYKSGIEPHSVPLEKAPPEISVSSLFQEMQAKAIETANTVADIGSKAVETGKVAVNEVAATVSETAGKTKDAVIDLAKGEHGAIGIGAVGKGALHGLAIVGAAMDIHEVATSDKPVETGIAKAGAWAAAGVGATAFAEAGAALGTVIAPGAGTVAGGVVGGLVGGAVGYIGGEAAVEKTIEIAKDNIEPVKESIILAAAEITADAQKAAEAVSDTVNTVTDTVQNIGLTVTGTVQSIENTIVTGAAALAQNAEKYIFSTTEAAEPEKTIDAATQGEEDLSSAENANKEAEVETQNSAEENLGSDQQIDSSQMVQEVQESQETSTDNAELATDSQEQDGQSLAACSDEQQNDEQAQDTLEVAAASSQEYCQENNQAEPIDGGQALEETNRNTDTPSERVVSHAAYPHASYENMASRLSAKLEAKENLTVQEIKAGDTLSQIAKQHGTTIEAIMKANPQILSADQIYAGEKIYLPQTHERQQAIQREAVETPADLFKEYNQSYEQEQAVAKTARGFEMPEKQTDIEQAAENNKDYSQALMAQAQYQDYSLCRVGDLNKVVVREKLAYENMLNVIDKQINELSGQPLSENQAAKLAIHNSLTNDERKVMPTQKALETERAQVDAALKHYAEYGKRTGLDQSLAKYVPGFLKSEEMKYYERGLKNAEQKDISLKTREADNNVKLEKLQEKMNQPEFKAAVTEKVKEMLASDKQRLEKLEQLKHEREQLAEYKGQVNDLRKALPYSIERKEVTIKGDPTDAKNLMGQADQIKSQTIPAMQQQAQQQNLESGLGR